MPVVVSLDFEEVVHQFFDHVAPCVQWMRHGTLVGEQANTLDGLSEKAYGLQLLLVHVVVGDDAALELDGIRSLGEDAGEELVDGFRPRALFETLWVSPPLPVAGIETPAHMQHLEPPVEGVHVIVIVIVEAHGSTDHGIVEEREEVLDACPANGKAEEGVDGGSDRAESSEAPVGQRGCHTGAVEDRVKSRFDQGSEPAEIWAHHDDIAGREGGIGPDQMEEGIAEGLYLPGCAVAGVDLDRAIPAGCSECGGRRHGWWTVGVLVDGGLETFKQCGISCPGCEVDPFHDRHVGQEVGCWGRRSTPGLRQRVSARARPRR